MNDEKPGLCSIFFVMAGLGFVGYVAYLILKEFTGPNGLENVLELLKGLGICLGAVILGMIVFYLIALMSLRGNKFEFIRVSQDVPVRIDNFKLHPNEAARNAEMSGGGTTITVEVPIYLILTITNQGLHLAPFPAENDPIEIPFDNASRYEEMFLGHADPVILPVAGYFMYFRRYQRVNQRYVERHPGYFPGQYGELPPDIGDDRITIVITNTSFMDEKQPYPPVYHFRQAGVMFTLVALNSGGREDPVLTRKLYCEIDDYFKPRPDSSYEDYYGY